MSEKGTAWSQTEGQHHLSRFNRPPLLIGYTYDPEDAHRARDENRLLTIRLETNHSCNLRCRYCYAEGGTRLKDELGYADLTDIITQAKELGAHSIVVIGGGEPTLHPRFRELITFIHAEGIIPMVFTNTVTMTPEMAAFLYHSNASVMGKLDSLRPETQDFLAGRKGAFERIQRGLDNLINAGFTQIDEPRGLRLGVSFVTNRLNLDEIEAIWHFCRRRNIFPNMEILTPTGRAKEKLAGYGISREEIKDLKLRLLEIDRRCYGYDWLPYTPLAASGCLQYFYSLYVTIEGNIRPCAPTKFDKNPALKQDGVYPHNIKSHPLREIYEDALFQYVRNIDRHLEGKCRNCAHLDECIGCRGYTYSVATNEGKGPYQALRAECLQCFK